MNLPEHSSDVVLTMLIGNEKVALSHVGSKSVIMQRISSAHPPTNAELIIEVDGTADKKTIFLPHGISSDNARVAYL